VKEIIALSTVGSKYDDSNGFYEFLIQVSSIKFKVSIVFKRGLFKIIIVHSVIRDL